MKNMQGHGEEFPQEAAAAARHQSFRQLLDRTEENPPKKNKKEEGL